MNEPCADNNYLADHAELILSSLLRLTGRALVDSSLPQGQRPRALFEAPFCVVSHDTAADPIFNYANRAALKLFEMSWQDFTRLPSRLSAEQLVREERERLLARVTEQGFIDDYRGVRISATGRRFFIEDSVVWNLVDESGTHRGQAAVLFRWTEL